MLLESLTERKHDVDERGILEVLSYLTRSQTPADKKTRAKLKGLCDRSIDRIARAMRPLTSYPGFQTIVRTLEALKSQLEALEKRA